jgi:hypothetical protein
LSDKKIREGSEHLESGDNIEERKKKSEGTIKKENQENRMQTLNRVIILLNGNEIKGCNLNTHSLRSNTITYSCITPTFGIDHVYLVKLPKNKRIGTFVSNPFFVAEVSSGFEPL